MPPGGDAPVPGVGFDLAAAPPGLIGGARTALPAITRLGTIIEGIGPDLVGIFGLVAALLIGLLLTAVRRRRAT